jgi:hypothetical protein
MSPGSMFIESAAGDLARLPDWLIRDQMKELTDFGDDRARTLGATGISADLKVGYALGLQTARSVLAGDVVLVTKGIDPKELL